jgi:hypothetical protein
VRAATFQTGSSTAQSDLALWRRFVSALFLLSFFWISYVSQTHVHGPSVTAAAASAIVKSVQLGGNRADQPPAKHNPDDQDDCPLCQAVSHGGIAVVPILLALLVLQSVIQSALPRPSERPSISHFGYAHQTRGPPIP